MCYVEVQKSELRALSLSWWSLPHSRCSVATCRTLAHVKQVGCVGPLGFRARTFSRDASSRGPLLPAAVKRGSFFGFDSSRSEPAWPRFLGPSGARRRRSVEHNVAGSSSAFSRSLRESSCRVSLHHIRSHRTLKCTEAAARPDCLSPSAGCVAAVRGACKAARL